MSHRRELKGSNIFLKEDLSREMRGLDYDARVLAMHASHIVKYYTRLDHVLIIFVENTNGVKVYSRKSLTDLLAHVDQFGIPKGADVPIAPRQEANDDEACMEDDGNSIAPKPATGGGILDCKLLPDNFAPDKVTPGELNQYMQKTEEVLSRLGEMKAKFYENLDKPDLPNPELLQYVFHFILWCFFLNCYSVSYVSRWRDLQGESTPSIVYYRASHVTRLYKWSLDFGDDLCSNELHQITLDNSRLCVLRRFYLG